MALTQVDQGLLGTYAQYTGFKNRIINGAMMIDQRNAGASVTIGNAGNLVYTLDRWAAYCDQNSKFSVEQTVAGVAAPAGFTDYLGATSLSAYSVGASEAFGLQQIVEGFNTADLAWGTASALAVTLSFKVYSSLTGTFGGSLRNSAGNRSYPFSYTVSAANTWTTISITIAGDTTGTWLTTNGAGIKIWFSLGAGSTFSGTAGAWSGTQYLTTTGSVSVVGTSGATFYITGVQLEKGSTATSFDYRPYGTELALCQRYYQTAGISFVGCWTAGAAAFLTSYSLLPVLMRANPTVPQPPSFTMQGITASAAGFTVIGGTYYVTVSGNNANGQGDGVCRTISPSTTTILNAEL